MVATKFLGDWEWSGHQCRSW